VYAAPGASLNMLLAIDVGNSSVKVGAFQGSNLIGRWRLSTVYSHTARDWSDLIRRLCSSTARMENLEGIVIASVVPVLDAPLAVMGERYFGVETLFVTPDTDTGVKVRYDKPGELGADRLVNSAAAFHRYGGPALIVDLGTAINFDIVSAEGEFLGGLICPGIEMCLQALHARTARLPIVDFRRPASLIGTNTVRCIRSGMYYGLAGMIDGIAERVIAEFAGKMIVIATGGHAQKIAAESRLIKEINEELTLQGLETIWRRNQTGRLYSNGSLDLAVSLRENALADSDLLTR
jgi:type III pantothenate kinase